MSIAEVNLQVAESEVNRGENVLRPNLRPREGLACKRLRGRFQGRKLCSAGARKIYVPHQHRMKSDPVNIRGDRPVCGVKVLCLAGDLSLIQNRVERVRNLVG